MICSSGYILSKCAQPRQDMIDEARWLLPHFKEAKKTVNCSYNIVDIRHRLELDTGLKHNYHCKGAIVMMLIDAGFDYKLDIHGEPSFNLSKKFKIGVKND